MRKAAVVRLTDEQRADLTRRLEREALTGRRRRRLQVLLAADRQQTDAQIAAATGARAVHRRTPTQAFRP